MFFSSKVLAHGFSFFFSFFFYFFLFFVCSGIVSAKEVLKGDY